MTALTFLPTPAIGEDCFCSCLVCHKPRREEDGAVRGAPVEWLVRMRLGAQTIWQGLHTECWERNRNPIAASPPGPPAYEESEKNFGVEPLKCAWQSETPGAFDDSAGYVLEVCETGKPATFIDCTVLGADMKPRKVCEDHRCRCAQPISPEKT